ncbi:hypothetical protein OKW38_001223 [Paraburkholderia sp. MM5496-R1]
MKKNYKHLSAEERAAIMIEHRKGGSIRSIAGLLGRVASPGVRLLVVLSESYRHGPGAVKSG